MTEPSIEDTASRGPLVHDNDIGILQRRRIEAAIIAPLYEAMREEVEEAKAQAILDRVIRGAAIAAAQGFAERTPGGTTMESFRQIQELWTRDDALTIEVLTETEDRFDFNVHRCRYAEAYRAMGLGAIGHLLSCNRDGAFSEGYNPRLAFKRTQTIMGGAPYCDFRYRMQGRNERPEEEPAIGNDGAEP